VTIG